MPTGVHPPGRVGAQHDVRLLDQRTRCDDISAEQQFNEHAEREHHQETKHGQYDAFAGSDRKYGVSVGGRQGCIEDGGRSPKEGDGAYYGQRHSEESPAGVPHEASSSSSLTRSTRSLVEKGLVT